MNACKFGEAISVSKESGLGKAYHESKLDKATDNGFF